jgi:hypothetical protein
MKIKKIEDLLRIYVTSGCSSIEDFINKVKDDPEIIRVQNLLKKPAITMKIKAQ